MEQLKQFGIIPVNYSTLESAYSLSSFKDKAGFLEEKGSIIRLKKGLYVVSPTITGKELSIELIANHIYGPSYVSMESALRFYGLIPEMVYNTGSMTLKRSRKFTNSLGEFTYTSCQADYYNIGIRNEIYEDHAFLIASPEKALCDLITYTQGLSIRSVKSLQTFLQDDLRIDYESIYSMDKTIFEQSMSVSKKKSAIEYILKLYK